MSPQGRLGRLLRVRLRALPRGRAGLGTSRPLAANGTSERLPGRLALDGTSERSPTPKGAQIPFRSPISCHLRTFDRSEIRFPATGGRATVQKSESAPRAAARRFRSRNPRHGRLRDRSEVRFRAMGIDAVRIGSCDTDGWNRLEGWCMLRVKAWSFGGGRRHGWMCCRSEAGPCAMGGVTVVQRDGSAPQGVETTSYLFGSLVLRRATACRASCLECWVLSQLASDAGPLPCARTSRG